MFNVFRAKIVFDGEWVGEGVGKFLAPCMRLAI